MSVGSIQPITSCVRQTRISIFFLLTVVLLAGALSVSGQSNVSNTKTQDADKQPALEQTNKLQARGWLRGRVTESGRPVADASISFMPANFTSNQQATVASMFRGVTSDADGKFELTDVATGAYHIVAWAPGYVLSDDDASRLYRPGDNVSLALIKGGVITGKVTSSSGQPVVGAHIRAIRIKHSENRVVRQADTGLTTSMRLSMGEWVADDRGIYRIYGLAPGIYQVAAGGRSALSYSAGGYDGDAPTYYPSSTPDTATEVPVRAGEEA